MGNSYEGSIPDRLGIREIPLTIANPRSGIQGLMVSVLDAFIMFMLSPFY